MPEPIRQHYVNRAYLAAFTDLGTSEGALNVVGFEANKSFKTGVNSIALVSNLYTCYELKPDPYAFEKRLSKIEGEAKSVLDKILSNGQLPATDDVSTLILYISLMEARNPLFENHIVAFENWAIGKSGTEVAERLVALNSVRIDFDSDKKVSGKRMANEADVLEWRRFILEKKPSAKWLFLNSIVNYADELNSALCQRKWYVCRAAQNCGEFVASDYPVGLVLDSKNKNGQKRHEGFLSPMTMVTFAVSPELILVGSYEKRDDSVRFGETEVATCNYATIALSKYVFSKSGAFKWLDNFSGPNGTIKEHTELLDQRDVILAQRNPTAIP